MWLLCLFGFALCLWAAFFNGAEKLEGTILGYFEFGQFAEKAGYIRAVAIIGLFLTFIGFLMDLLA